MFLQKHQLRREFMADLVFLLVGIGGVVALGVYARLLARLS
jgi:hypothetical protein